MDTAPPFALYNPAMLAPGVLLSEFTARRPLLARLLDIVRANDPGEPPQHVLCVGPRGMGKTTLLCAIAATIKLHEPELARHWQPVIFDEESRRIGDLADFWLECIRQWESETEPTLTRSHRIDALLAKPGPDIEDKAREVFLSLVDASGKRALLLIDNLNDIFIAVNDAESLMRLRSFLMSDPRVMIIGAATRWFSDVTGLDKPFFEFFRPFDLHALSLEEMRECLAGVATARGDQRVLDTLRDRPGSIEVLHILTGGNPRLIRTFYRLLNEGMNGELRLQLERLIDDYTPYHKAIIDALPGQQQRVLDAIALEWNPTDVSTVARTTRLPSNQVSAQIKALIKTGLISEAANMGHSKKKAYLLTDRFSNIHYLMRHGRTGKLKMHWYLMTLGALFNDVEFEKMAANSAKTTFTSQLRNENISMAPSDEDLDLELAQQWLDQFLAQNLNGVFDQYDQSKLMRLNRDKEAEMGYRKSISLDPMQWEAWNNLGLLLGDDPARQAEAETAFQKACDINPTSSKPLIGLGSLLERDPRKRGMAEAAYRKAIDLNPSGFAAWAHLSDLLYKELRTLRVSAGLLLKSTETNPTMGRNWTLLGVALSSQITTNAEAEAARGMAIALDSKHKLSSGCPSHAFVVGPMPKFDEAARALAKGFSLEPQSTIARGCFRELCFNHASALISTLVEMSQWCGQNPHAGDVHKFMIDAWIACAKTTTAAEACQLLDAQPDEVKLAFETVGDAFLAHDDKDHLHRLAPERRAPVLKLLERL